MTVEIRLLGPLEVCTVDGSVSAADFRSKKSQRVFEVLALAGGQTVSKDALVDTLWRHRVPNHPAATVEVAVSLLRSTLARIGAASAIATEPGGYRLDPAVVAIDVLAFDRAMVTAERSPDRERVALLQPALATVRGALLEDEPALDWLALHRERSRRRVELARLMLARSALMCGDDVLAFATAEVAWTLADVVLEDAYAIGAEALLAQGRRSEAAALLLAADERLRRERSTTAGPALLAVREQLERPFELRGSGVPVPIGPALAALRSPLPFLGRRDELALVEQLVRDVADGAGDREGAGHRGSSWLHVEGSRGVGKSLLLEQMERRVRASNPGVVVYRMQCSHGDASVGSLAAVRLARLVGVRDEAVDAALFLGLAARLDAGGTTVLLVDDLHHADDASVAIIRSLASAGGACSLVVVSSGGSAPEGSRALVLGRLTPSELAAVGDQSVWEATAGHPMVLAACARAAGATGFLDVRGTRDLCSIVGDLGPSAAVVVGLAARSMTPIGIDAVSTLTGLGIGEVRRAVDAAVGVGVVRLHPDDAITPRSALFRAIFTR